MGHYLRVYKVLGQTFGLWFRPLGAFLLLQLRQVISAITLGLDHVFYPRHRKQAIDRPIFIIGNPRSGTTFLHRLLTRSRRHGRSRVVGDVVSGYHRAQTARRYRAPVGQAVTGPLPPVRCARHQPARYRDRRRGVVLSDHGRPFRVGVFPCLARHLGK